jgi:hypothetical protein
MRLIKSMLVSELVSLSLVKRAELDLATRKLRDIK